MIRALRVYCPSRAIFGSWTIADCTRLTRNPMISGAFLFQVDLLWAYTDLSITLVSGKGT